MQPFNVNPMPPTVRPPKKSAPTWVLPVLLCGAAFVFFIGIVTAVISPSRNVETVAATPVEVTTTAPATTSTTEEPTTTSTTSVHTAMLTWSLSAVPVFSILSSDMGDVSQAAKSSNYAGVRSGCMALRSDLSQLDDLLPSPDPTVTRYLRSAVKDFRSSANYCISGVDNRSASDLNMCSTLMTSGTDSLTAALGEIHNL